MSAVDVSIVTYRPDERLLDALIGSIAEQCDGHAVHLFVLDNTPKGAAVAGIRALPSMQSSAFVTTSLRAAGTNLGFGRGHNANAELGEAPFILVLNQDCILEPGVLSPLLSLAQADDESVAAWELRQIPYEHPKAYDPVTLDVPWVSGAGSLFRRSAFEAVSGFDPHIFMYGEDVDLSWRLRARGHRLRYVPRLAVVHRTYRHAAEVKPLQVFGGVQTNLCLRVRYGGLARTLQGISMACGEILAPPEFPGRRAGLLKALFRFFTMWPQFAATRVAPTPNFRPVFNGWGYEIRRDGAFVPLSSRREAPASRTPVVSILIRTVGRTSWLRQALQSVANQTWPAIETVVVEDGPPQSQAVIDEFRERLAIVYKATGHRVGRARAGNLALAAATGEWLNFLDDDDVLFADHVEVLLDAVREKKARGAYGLSWETHTHIADPATGAFEEIAHITRHRQPFDRLTLWHHNYLPIQAVLFHRSLYERYGGFAEDMDQLEDWNLWTRYTLEEDFVLVDKTTSKYRVPAGAKEAAGRQELLDRAYRDAVERQRAMRLTVSPLDISRMAEVYMRTQSLVLVSRQDVRRFVMLRPWLARLAAWRGPLRRLMTGRRAV
ncbi:MAG TPA: glycosyltransferase family 2 protein [Casimicrobiaceae bacterium]|nr:glycosyltransferase family 2 protein [Casimicrobiaceae bacterium]